MQLIRIDTTRGRKVLVRLSDVQIVIGADGYVRSHTSFGPSTEKLLPFHQMVDINAGFSPELEEEE